MGKRILLLLVALLLGIAPLNAQNLPASRIADWSKAGYTGEIPCITPIVDVTTLGLKNDGITDNAAAIKTAFTNTPTPCVLYFPAGNYLFKSTIEMPSGKVLRGASPSTTKLLFNMPATWDMVASSCIFVGVRYDYENPAGPNHGPDNSAYFSSVTSGSNKGSTTLTLSSASAIVVGKYAELRQNNDSSVMNTGVVAWNEPWAINTVGQVFKVTAKNGNTITIDRPLHMDFKTSKNVRVRTMETVSEAGIENLYIERQNNVSGYPSNIQMRFAVNCWVRNVESVNCISKHIEMYTCANVEVRDSYFRGAWRTDGGYGYGIVCSSISGDNLIENNIVKGLRHALIMGTGANGNVYAYNYSDDNNTDMPIHGHYCFMNLFEGNIVGNVRCTDWWGPAGPGNTYFRNRIRGSLSVEDNSHNQNLLGNEVPSSVYVQSGVNGTLLHGNNTSGSVSYDPSYGTTLSNSFYLSSKPAFFGTTAWPSIGPANTYNSGSIPARDRFLAGQPVATLNCSASPLSISVSASANPVCAGASSVLTASGATTYSWAPSTGLSSTGGASVTASPSVTTTYTVTGTSGGSSATKSITLTVTPLPSVSVNPSATTISPGGSISLTASGASSYSWGPSAGLNTTSGSTVTATPASTTTYTVTGSTSGCSAIASATVTVNTGTSMQPPSASFWGVNGGPIDGNNSTYYFDGNLDQNAALRGKSSFWAGKAGFQWYRNYCSDGIIYSWQFVEPTQGNFNWSVWDLLVQKSQENGISLLACIGNSVPGWANGNSNWKNPPSDLYNSSMQSISWYKFVQAIVERYDGDGVNDMPGLTIPIKYWEVWNEPNLKINNAPWQFNGTVNDYIRLLQVAYTAVKAADPNAKVVAPALAGLINSGSGSNTWQLWQWNDFKNAGGLNYLDIISYHAYYGKEFGAADNYAWDVNNTVENDLANASNYRGGKPVWITETGWEADPTATYADKSNNFVRSVVHYWSKSFVDRYFWYSWQESETYTTNSHHKGFMQSLNGSSAKGTEPDPLVHPVHNVSTVMGRMLKNFTASDRPVLQSSTSATYRIFKFTKGSEDVYVAWNKAGSGTTSVYINTNGKTLKVVGLYGEDLGSFSGGYLTIGASPVYLTTNSAWNQNICRIAGRVKDAAKAGQYGNGVPGVTVKALGPVTKTVVTDTDGNYYFEDLPEGTYTVSLPAYPSSAPANYSLAINRQKSWGRTSFTISTLPPLTVNVSASSSAICSGQSSTLTASGATSYSWSPASGLSATSGTSVTASPVATTTYTVTGTGSGGATGTATITITVNPLPVVSVNPSAPTIYKGSNVTLNASGAGTYSWTPPAGLNSTSGPSVIAAPTVTTTYTVTGNSNGCVASKTVTVTVSNQVFVTALAMPATVCAGVSSVLSATGAVFYSWSPANGLSGTTGASVTASPAVTTTYTVTGSDSSGSSGTATVTVTVSGGPVVSITSSAMPVCQGNGASLVANAAGAVSYLWEPAAGLSSTNSFVTSAIVSSNITYTVTATDAAGCKGFASINITVIPSNPPNLDEGFEGSAFPPPGWTLESDDAKKFTRHNSVGAYSQSSHSAYIDNYYYYGYGKKDALVSPKYSLKGLASSILKFDVAYAQNYYGYYYTDTLVVYISTDCGSSWKQLYRKGGAALATSTKYSFSFTPKSSEWRTEQLDLLSYMGKESVMFKFENISKMGNTLYIDNIKLQTSGNMTSVPDYDASDAFMVYPNPGEGMFFVEMAASSEERTLSVNNALGQVVAVYVIPPGTERYPVTLNDMPKGLYHFLLKEGSSINSGKVLLK